MICEKCWSDAGFFETMGDETKTDVYHRFIEERKSNPCTPIEQAGQWWDEKKQFDSRVLNCRKD